MPSYTVGNLKLYALGVGTPLNDAPLDGLGGEVFGESAGDERWKLGVGGKAERDELRSGEPEDVRLGRERGDAEALFKAYDPVLHAERVEAHLGHRQQESEGDDDEPEMQAEIAVRAKRQNDGDDEVDQEDGKQGEVRDGIESGMVGCGLNLGHGRMIHAVVELALIEYTRSGRGGRSDAWVR